jgi:hypothetical protein
MDDGSFSVVTVLAPIPEMPSTVASATDEITINGNPLIVYAVPETIEAVVP